MAALAEILRARLSQVQIAAVAVQQPRLYGFFQVADMFAGHGGGNSKQLGRTGKTAALHHFTKHFEAEQGIHFFFLGNIASIIQVYIHQKEINTLQALHIAHQLPY